MDLTPAENLAVNMLRSQGELMQTLLNSTGQLEFGALYAFYEKLGRQLELAKIKRGNLFTDVIPLTVEGEPECQTSTNSS